MAQEKEIPARLFQVAPTIDGTVSEEEWAGAATVEGMFDEDTGDRIPEPSKLLIGYDSDFIYFAARLGDKNPSRIRANEYRTNVSLDGDDWVGVQIDLSGSGADFNEFKVNARGATEIELAGGRAAKREWTGEIFAKGRVTESGWEAEARIPWQIFQLPGAGERDLRINFSRNVASSNRESVHFFVPDGSNDHPFWRKVQVPPSRVARSLKLLAYSYAGWDPNTRHIFNSGLDMKTSVTDQVEFVGTINPDFRNIENQVLSLDFSRFERLAGESRPFFQEGREYMETQLFASQRIDNFDFGASTYGRLGGKTSFAVLNTVDFDRINLLNEAETRGTRNNFVANISHDFDPTLSFRASYTNVARPDLDNQARLLRLSKTFGDFNFFTRHMDSQDSVEGYGLQQDAYLTYERGGLGTFLGYVAVSPTYMPRLGFQEDRDLKGVDYGAWYNRRYDRGPINDWGLEVFGLSYDHYRGEPYRRYASGNVHATHRNGFAIVQGFEFGEFDGVPEHEYSIHLSYPRGNVTRNIGVSFAWGDHENKKYHSIGGTVAYKTLGRLQTNLRVQHVEHFERHDQLVLSANYDLGSDRSVAGRLVRSNENVNFYIALKQSGNLGTEYFLILGDPNAKRFRGSLILKVAVPFDIPLARSKVVRQAISGRGPAGR
jgi:hypothetical protein